MYINTYVKRFYLYSHIFTYIFLNNFIEFFKVPVDKIRVGRDYQAVCPELQPENQRKPELLADRALLVWSPTESIPESKCESFL